MITRSDLESKKEKVEFTMSKSETERANRLYQEGFFYLYRVGKKVYATDATLKKTRLVQGTDYEKLVDPVVILDYLPKKEEENTNDGV